MSEQIDLNNLGYIATPKLTAMQNVQVRAINFPEWMEEELVKALRSLFDQRVEYIEGLLSGLDLSFGVKGEASITPSGRSPALLWAELAGYPIQKTLEYWMRQAAEAFNKADDDKEFRYGPDIMLFEPNVTFTQSLRTWSIKNSVPRDSGQIVGVRQINPITGAESVLTVNFHGDFEYDNADDIRWAEEFLAAQYGTAVDPAVAKFDPVEMLKSITRLTMHFTVDELDPDPESTLAFVQKTARDQNIDLVIGGDPVDTTDGVRDEVLKALDERSAVIHLIVDKNEGDPAQTVKDLIKQFGEAGVHLAIHVDPANIPADAWGASAVLTATEVLHKEHTPSIKAFDGPESEEENREWFARAKAKMTDEQWDAFGVYDSTLMAPPGYIGKTVRFQRGNTSVSYVENYFELMRKWFDENITDKGIPGNEAPEGWKS